MIPGFRGAAFSAAPDGDARADGDARETFAARVGAPIEWATAVQVHGNTVLLAESGGLQGEGDALITEATGVAVAVFTADCVGMVIEADEAVAVVHAGWRGAAAGIAQATLNRMQDLGHEPVRAAIGPSIGPCCYEVGAEVAQLFPGHVSTTTWGTVSVDIAGFVSDTMAGVEVHRIGACTSCDDGYFSHRLDHTPKRQAAIGWMPSNR